MDTMIPNYMKSSTQKASGWSNFFKGLTNVLNPLGMVADVVGGIVNYNQQKKAFDYQKELNQTMMSREDTAIQRRMADLKASGLNPLLALGTPGASASSGTVGTAPQFDTSLQNKFNEIRMAQNEQRAFNETLRGLSLDNAQKVANIELTNSETDLKKQQINESKSKTTNLGADTSLKEAQRIVSEEQAQKIRKEKDSIDLNIVKQKYDNQILDWKVEEERIKHYFLLGDEQLNTMTEQQKNSWLTKQMKFALEEMQLSNIQKERAIEKLEKEISTHTYTEISRGLQMNVDSARSISDGILKWLTFGFSR